jgi:hypothetical protein
VSLTSPLDFLFESTVRISFPYLCLSAFNASEEELRRRLLKRPRTTAYHSTVLCYFSKCIQIFNKSYGTYVRETQGVTILIRLPDCWLVVSKHPEGPAIGHLDTGFLGFPLS